MISSEILRGLSGPCKLDRIQAIEKLKDQIPDDVLELLVNLEQVQPTLIDCRNKERYLEDLVRLSIAQSEDVIVCVFHHFLGTLYINFERFWGPTIRAIVDLINLKKYATRLLCIILDEFRVTNDRIYRDIVTELPEDRPDHVLHRNFILQILAKFPDFVETNNITFMDNLFRFIEAELMISPFIERLAKQDLTKDDKPAKTAGSKRRLKRDTNRSKSKETFITASRIIQTFHDMSSVHRSDQFREFILLLMSSRDGSMQKAAFKCFLAYNVEHVRQYTDKILRLLDDKKIRSELSTFSIDSENGLVNPDHRAKLIPVIHRILFGRMVGKIGKKTIGRDKADKRKQTVMCYISGCTTDEIVSFFELSFDPVFKYSNATYDELRDVLKRDMSIRNYVPLNKLQAMISTLKAYLDSVANLKPETLPLSMKMIGIITTLVLIPLEDSQVFNQLCSRSVKTLKILKRNCLDIAMDFFKSFPYYRFTQPEIDFVFSNLIWPATDGFIDKNHATVTPMLRFIGIFMENDVYHMLIIKRNKKNFEEYLLRNLVNLYDSDKVDRSVSKYIAQMLCNLLKLGLDEDENIQIDGADVDRYKLDDEDSRLPAYNSSLYKVDGSDMTLGFRMIMCFVPEVINRLKKNCETFLEKKSSNFRLEKSELLILSALSGYLKDSSHCLVATKLLLSTIEYQKDADLIINTLQTARSLLGQVNELDDSKIVDFIANVLSYQGNSEQRREVCSLVKIVASIDPTLISAGNAVILLNSTVDDLSEVPNLENWNEGFNLAFQYLDSLNGQTMNDTSKVLQPLTLLLHQVGFIVNTIDRYDFSVRENCMIFYDKVTSRLNLIDQSQNSNMLNKLLDTVLLKKFIKKGVRNTNESIKHTHLGILRITASNCHERNQVLRDCNMFCNPNQDLDFWTNIRHIQLHNRSKALSRLLADENLHKVSRRTLSSYFLPIASGFLFNKNYKSVAALSDNAIKLIGFICKNLSWKTYEATLSYYLDMLTKANATYQRTNIKLITEILRNFNFDLTACEEAMQFEEENQKLERRMRKRLGQYPIQEGTKKLARLNPSMAKLIYDSVTKKLIPQLNSCLNEMTRVDFEYDKNMSDYMPEKEEIKRIPIAYAIVQLLCLLPGRYVILRDQLPPIFLKLTTFLRSKNEATRKAARANLLRILSFVGPMYLADMLRILKQQLDKGFYIHVLNYTVHSVLDGMTLNYGDIDGSVTDLVDLCKQEIFGRPSEDKEIAQILSKTSEAKKTKSYDTLAIIASFISAEELKTLIIPFKDLLKTSTEPKVVNKLSVCLQRIFTGLSQNNDFPIDELIEFIQSSIEDSIPSLKVREKERETDSTHSKFVREDRFIIEEDKSKNRVKSRINEKGNLHMVVENSLRLLLLVFEKNKSSIKRKEALQRKLNGFITLLTTCLKSSSPRCVMRSLKCLHFIAQTKIDLPNFETECESIVKKIFIILSLYNGVGMVQGDNYEMIAMCFKTLTLLLLKCKHAKLNDIQVRALMSYIEQDLNDASRQSTAFKALDSLLRRGCKSPELVEIMKKVGEILVRSSDESIRSLCVKIWQTYLFEYQHDSVTLQSHLNGFIRQIDYEFIDGRKSIFKLLKVIVEKTPESILRNNFDLNFPLLAERIVNDDSKEVRLIVGRLIVLLVQRIPDIQEYALNKFIMPWASVDNSTIRILGIKLLSTLIEANTAVLEKNSNKILTIILKSIQPADTVTKSGGTPQDISESDKLAYHAIRLFARFIDRGLLETDEAQSVWQNIACHQLDHWHEPIVLTSCKLYIPYLTKTSHLDKKLTRTLCDKFIELLDRYDSTNPIHAYSTQGLMILGQSIANSKVTLEFEQNYIESFENRDILGFMRKLDNLPDDGFVHEKLPYNVAEVRKKCNLMWIAVKMLMQAKKEAALYRLNESHRRDLMLRWSAVIAQELGSTRIAPYAILLMMTPVRELTDKSPVPSLVPLAEDLLKFIKSLVGVSKFNEIYSKVQLHYNRKRIERKRDAAVLKVRDQSRGSKRKIEVNKKKQAVKKKRIVERKVAK